VSDELHEVAFSPAEVEHILAVCGAKALLVGGQSLAFWALHYDVRPVGVLSESITMDVDFIGTAEVAALLTARLGESWQLRQATLDDAGVQLAKVYQVLPGNGLKQIDFLRGIVGVDAQSAHNRAVEIDTLGGATVRVLHPLDVLESRLRNLELLPGTRNAVGIAQAKLAVEVVRAFIEHRLAEGESPGVVFQAIKRVKKLALSARLANTAFEYDIDVLSAIPVERIAKPKFHERFWPDVLARLKVKRERYRSTLAKRANDKT
jgi:hypothetical protein